jgi:hypothetical protein
MRIWSSCEWCASLSRTHKLFTGVLTFVYSLLVFTMGDFQDHDLLQDSLSPNTLVPLVLVHFIATIFKA